ncbi:MAG: cupin domain-containing protein [Notoacmeibacter sp.]|nr:cupin domain-containing protein [Notoacmeibacter sp.]
MSDQPPLSLVAADVEPRIGSAYPAEFAARVAGREKRVLGNPFGLTNFGVNCTTLKPGAESALMHRHKTQDEFVFILEGTATLVTDRGEAELTPGMCAGFPKGGLAHQLVNRTGANVVYLEIGDRSPGDVGSYPVDDLQAVQDEAGKWQFLHKDGTPY